MTKLTALFLLCLIASPHLSAEPLSFSINTKKWSHILDDHFISITINPTDLLQGRIYGLAVNSTLSILKGLAPAYVRIGSADTGKYTFKRKRYLNDMTKLEDEYTVTETHWMVFNEVAHSAGLDVIVCLNPAHRIEGTKKWDTRNSLELISFSDSQGYNLTWQLGYEVQPGEELSGIQFGKDLNRLRTILNAFPRYQHAKLIGPDIRAIHKKEDIDFWNDVLIEAGPTLDAVTWHPRWPQPSKMKVSDNSDLGYEFPVDYLEWDRNQLNKILQRTIFKNPVWIGETKRESTGTFAEGLIWARRLVLAAKIGIEVVMKQPNLMDITHPKPEYWIALLHKRLLGKSVLETKSVTNHTEVAVIAHCTNPAYWSDKPEKLQDGPITVYGVNMGGLEQKIQIKGTWNGKSQLLFQYVLTSGSDPDSVFSQMTYVNGEPILMTDDGNLPDIIPKIKKFERGLILKLPPYSVGFWVIPEAKVKICQVQPQDIPTINIETLTPSLSHKAAPNNLQNIRDINQFLVDKLTNPVEESAETPEVKIEPASSESSEKDLNLLSKEINMPRVARRIRQVRGLGEINRELKTIMEETQALFTKPKEIPTLQMKLPKATPTMEHRIQSIAQGISDAIKSTNQQQEFDKFLQDSGLKQDFGALMMNDRKFNAPEMRNLQVPNLESNRRDLKTRLRRSITESEDYSGDESSEKSDEQSEEELESKFKSEKLKPIFNKKITLVKEEEEENKKNRKQDLVVPHNPDIKGLEEKYKSVIQSKLQDEKRKIDDIKRKIKQEEVEVNKKIKPPEAVTDIREEIIKKEIQLIEKTEETVADILKSQKKRQETFGDIIFDELNDVKEERMSALEEIQKNQKRKENTIVKRHSPTPLSGPILKTVEYIEKNFNLEPESVRKIKRSLEEKMGEILRNYDTKKSLETRKRLIPPKDEKKILTRKPYNDDSKPDTFSKQTYSERNENTEDTRNYQLNKDRPKDKNIIRKTIVSPSKVSYISGRSMRKQEADSENSREIIYKSTKNEDRKKGEDNVNSSFDSFNDRKPQETVRKFDRRRTYNEGSEEKLTKNNKKEKDFKMIEKDELKKTKPEFDIRKKVKEDKNFEIKKKEVVEDEEEVYIEEKKVPLKNDKQRRENMLKHITSMVEHMNSNEENGDKSKRLNEDEDISEEFESERRSKKIKRRPRKAEVSEFQFLSPPSERLSEQNVEAFLPTETPITSSTSAGKLSKLKKHRIRPNRKLKITKPNDEEDTIQKKRHLTNLARPLLELEKKKLLVPKVRKLHSKILRPGGNELTLNEKDKDKTNEKNLMMVVNTPVDVPITVTDPPKKNEKDIVKELEEMVQQKHFLGQATEPSIKESETLGKNFLEDQKETEMNFSGETPTPTEGYIIVEPTIEIETTKISTTEKPKDDASKSSSEAKDNQEEKNNQTDDLNKSVDSESSATDFGSEKKEKPVVDENPKTEKSEEKEHSEKAKNLYSTQEESSEEVLSERENLSSSTDSSKNENESFLSMEEESIEESKPTENEKKMIELPMKNKNDMIKLPVKNKDDFIESPMKNENNMIELPVKNKNDMIELLAKSKKNIIESPIKMEEFLKEGSEKVSDIEETNIHKNQRKRRATFVENHDDEDDEDYSSEERIKKFKQMVYRKSPAKKPVTNEVRSRGTFGAADELLRMAGSTVRVMFDDVIPEAYGQTKTKIQNMGISEYIKEFGKIVQQMKNLDQIFLNIGEAAVKGYIRGNRAEKGPYIQVISRKKRSLNNGKIQKEDDSVIHSSLAEIETTEEVVPITETEKTEMSVRQNKNEEVSDQTILTTDSSTEKVTSETHSQLDSTEIDRNAHEKPEENGEKYETTSSSETRSFGAGIVSSESRSGPSSQRKTEEKNRKEEKEEEMAQKILETSSTSTKEFPAKTEPSDDNKQSSVLGMNDNKPKIYKNVPKLTKRVSAKLKKYDKSDLETTITDYEPKLNPYLTNEMQDKLSPWIKTTKDFIQQALTTLQRQKQLSEIIARESINDLMNRDETTKTVGKRETGTEEPKLPVFHMNPPKLNKKRETFQKQTDESLIQQLKGLHPGVYVVPTEEMTNIRSEQFTNEAKQKSGLPNVVTLNIYYDKKNQVGSAKTDATTQVTDPVVAYYQNKAWNAAEAQYDQNNQFLSPMTVPEVNIPTSVVAQVPVASPIQTSLYAPDPKISNLPNSRLIQYSSPTFHYPPTQKVYPSILAKNGQPVFSPVFYVQPETRFIPQPPGTKRQWYEFKARNPAVQTGAPGWSIQYETVPGSVRVPSKSSFNKHFKMFSDKKRSVGDFKMDPKWSEAALPFWKFFATSEKNEENLNTEDSRENVESVSTETESAEDIFEENRKRAKEAEEKKNKVPAEEPINEEEQTEKSKSRKRRSVSETNKNELPNGLRIRKLVKRSYPYTVEFRDHKVLPEWFGPYQEIENTIEDLSPHIRRSHIVSTPWSDDDEELLSILDADDELTLAGVNNDDYYYGNENAIGHLRRYRRSTDQSESSMLKTNMIYKTPIDNQIFRNKIFGKTGMKKLGDEDNSLELMTKPRVLESGTKSPEIKLSLQPERQQDHVLTQTPMTAQLITPIPQQSQPPQQLVKQPQQIMLQLPPSGILLPRNPNDDTFYYFFKYAYDSLVKVMKSMTELF